MSISQDPVPGRTALILYGSETGNAQDVAEELGRLTQRLRFATQVSELNNTNLKQLVNHTITLFAISTTGQGDLPLNAQSFWKSLRSIRLRPGCLQQLHFASFGLGDSSYPKFNWAHRKLYNRLIQLGAQPICDRGESDEQHPEGIDGTFLPWTLNLRQHILQTHPLPEGVECIPDDVFLRPKWELRLLNPQTSNGTHDGHISHDQRLLEDAPEETLLPIKNGFTATIERNERLTPSNHWQDVRHLTLRSNPIRYGPGDVLTLYPKNFPSDVSHLLKIMNWTSVADEPLEFVSTAPQPATTTDHIHSPLSNSSHIERLTLRSLLTNHLDIMSIPRRSFFATLAHFTDDEFQRERLLEFTNPEYLDELYDYTTRPRRSILEVLQEFETVKVPWQSVCSLIPLLRGRQFSIASGGELKGDAQQTNIELLIAIVKYKTVIKRIRQGVCTRYVASLRPGQQITVTLQQGSLGVTKEDVKRPVVMIGPGTGVAPMRSLVHERLMHSNDFSAHGMGTSQNQSKTQDLLFFGCRNENADFFFQDEWTSLSQKGLLEVHAAFSRDQRQKVYVQDLVRKESKKVYSALHDFNGLLYICGSSGKMPQAVREALIEVIQKEGQLTRDNAEGYLVNMEKTGRYKQETW